MINYLLMCDAAAVSAVFEGQPAGGSSYWYIVLICIIMAAACFAGIITFAVGLVRCNNLIAILRRKGSDCEIPRKLRTQIIVFFVLTMAIPLINIFFAILLITTVGKLNKYAKSDECLLYLSREDVINNYDNHRRERRVHPRLAEEYADRNQKQAELIRQYKELLDSGAITEEEYNIKKKEILG